MLKSLQKPGVQMGLLSIVIIGAGVAFFLARQPAAPVNAPPEETARAGTASTSQGKPSAPQTLNMEDQKKNLGEKRTAKIGSDQQVERFIIPTKKQPPPSVVQLGGPRQQQDKPPPPFPKLVHVTNPQPEPFAPSEPRLFAPRGTLIKAALVLTLDSSALDTPVLALVTEDVYWNNRLIVPAGTQVLAQASQGRVRDRIEIKGTYTFIWADGREYNISCVALDHERLSDGSYAITDGSAGVRGQIVKNDQYAELKIMVAEALQGVMNNNQNQFQSIYGLVPQNTSRNAALGGGSQAASAYSQLLTKKLDQDLDFVRVAAGTQFYIFTKEVFEPELASVAGLRQGGRAATSWQLAEEAYQRAQTASAETEADKARVSETTRKAEQEKKTAERAARVSSVLNASSAAATPSAEAAAPSGESDSAASSNPASSSTP